MLPGDTSWHNNSRRLCCTRQILSAIQWILGVPWNSLLCAIVRTLIWEWYLTRTGTCPRCYAHVQMDLHGRCPSHQWLICALEEKSSCLVSDGWGKGKWSNLMQNVFLRNRSAYKYNSDIYSTSCHLVWVSATGYSVVRLMFLLFTIDPELSNALYLPNMYSVNILSKYYLNDVDNHSDTYFIVFVMLHFGQGGGGVNINHQGMQGPRHTLYF